MAWKTGPMPKDTWNWGAVVKKGDSPSVGFFFADFCGDHVLLCPSGERVEAADIAQYNNSIDLPSGGTVTARSN